VNPVRFLGVLDPFDTIEKEDPPILGAEIGCAEGLVGAGGDQSSELIRQAFSAENF
jgi:hypothetical protein